MNMSKIDDIRLLISLDTEDMKSLGIDFDRFLWSDRNSRNIMRELLYMAAEETGFSAKNQRLMIELIPLDSGCAILFTIMERALNSQKKKFKIKNKYGPYIYEFKNAGDLLDAVEHLFHLNTNIKSSIAVEFKGKYYLIIHPNGGITTAVSVVLTEYGVWKGAGKISESKLLEYGNVISHRCAIEQIGQYM